MLPVGGGELPVRVGAGPGGFVVRDHRAGMGAVNRRFDLTGRHQLVGPDIAVVFRLHRPCSDPVETALGQPLTADRRQAGERVSLSDVK